MIDLARLRSGTAALLASLAVVGLAGCGGSGNSGTNILGTSNAQVRFVNGSSGAGSVDVVIDGTSKFSNAAYASATNYLSLGTGTHSVTVYPAGNDVASAAILSNTTFSVNSAGFETLALGGITPSTLYAVSDQVFSGTYNGYGAVNFYNFSPAAGTSGVQFGFYYNPTSASASPTLTDLGSVIPLGTASGPVGVPSSIALGFAAAPAGSTTAFATVKPSQIDSSGCSANTFACNSGLVSIFLIDGQNSGSKLVGIFSATGT